MATASVKSNFLNSTLSTARRTRQAYIGAHVLAFEFAQKRTAQRVDQLKAFGAYLVAKGETVETSASDSFAEAREKVTGLLPKSDAPKTINVKPTRVAKKAKPVDLSTDITKKARAVKTDSKTQTTAAKSEKIVTDKYAAHVDSAAKYDAQVNPLHIKKIVDHLGIALASRDGKFVACSDASERETVAKSWLMKKLGVEGDAIALDAKVGAVCDMMKSSRMKPRVTFYYLLAKNEGQLGKL